MKNKFQYILVSVIIFTSIASYAQQPTQVRKIEITRSEYIAFDDDFQRVVGFVEFKHEGMTMTCDSAYYYDKRNSLDAFGNVHITNAERSVTIDGDFAKYHGDIKLSEIWNHVVLVDSNAVLKTQHLYYEMNTNIAYYNVGAEITNEANEMVSRYGHYYRNTDMFYFKKDVVLTTPDYIIVTDTLNYNVKTKIADFVGPTFILRDKDTIYCERGWYNTNDTVALFRRNAWIKSGSTTVNADTLFYESQTGNGRAFGNIVIVDTTNNVILKGHKGAFNKPKESGWLTNNALMIMAGEKDSLFLHADTLRSDVDTSGFKVLKSYNRARFFSADMQGKCDSLVLSLKDTIIRMYRIPVLWAQDNQMTAEYIEIETENQKPKRMNLLNKAFIVQEDLSGFNQIKSKKIVGFFRDNELFRVNGYEDSETVYFLYDGTDVTGVNKMKSTNIVIFIEDRRAQEVRTYINVEGEMIPPNELDTSELTLLGFKWLIHLRPIDKNDIFDWREDTAENAGTASATGNASEKPTNIKPDASSGGRPIRNN